VLPDSRAPVLDALKHISTLPGGREAIRARSAGLSEHNRADIARILE